VGLNGLGEKGTPEEKGAPKEKGEEAKRLRKGKGELGQREGVRRDDGEESEG
jgi:hypothetical protein